MPCAHVVFSHTIPFDTLFVVRRLALPQLFCRGKQDKLNDSGSRSDEYDFQDVNTEGIRTYPGLSTMTSNLSSAAAGMKPCHSETMGSLTWRGY